jgi:hypothetical protein
MRTDLYLAALLIGLVPSSPRGEDAIALAIEAQACRTAEFNVSFDDEARSRFTSCEHPMAGYEFAIWSDGKKIASARLDENGNAVLDSIVVSVEAEIELQISSETEERCFHLKSLVAGKPPLTAGRHFLFYENGDLRGVSVPALLDALAIVRPGQRLRLGV